MFYQNGDKVRITTQNTTYTGKTGVIVNAFKDEVSLLVRMDEKGNDVGFFVGELELVWSEEDMKHINGIAGSLINEDRYVQWEWKDALETAASLYKVGVRFNG